MTENDPAQVAPADFSDVDEAAAFAQSDALRHYPPLSHSERRRIVIDYMADVSRRAAKVGGTIRTERAIDAALNAIAASEEAVAALRQDFVNKRKAGVTQAE